MVSFAAACFAGHPRNDDLRATRGIEGPFVNSPNARLRPRCVSSVREAASLGVLYDIAGLD